MISDRAATLCLSLSYPFSLSLPPPFFLPISAHPLPPISVYPFFSPLSNRPFPPTPPPPISLPVPFIQYLSLPYTFPPHLSSHLYILTISLSANSSPSTSFFPPISVCKSSPSHICVSIPYLESLCTYSFYPISTPIPLLPLICIPIPNVSSLAPIPALPSFKPISLLSFFSTCSLSLRSHYPFLLLFQYSFLAPHSSVPFFNSPHSVPIPVCPRGTHHILPLPHLQWASLHTPLPTPPVTPRPP